ncbi:MAG: hypothetical protein Q9167_003392 [Letrouitia subvulpina]
MSQRPNRSFSFGENDGTDMNSHNNDRLSQGQQPYAYANPLLREQPPDPPAHRSPFRLAQGAGSSSSRPQQLPPSSRAARSQGEGNRHGNLGHSTSNRTTSTITPGVDNMAATAAGGGIAGIAYGVANTHERESGVEALRSLEGLQQSGRGLPPERGYDTLGADNPYVPEPPSHQQAGFERDPLSSPAPSTLNPFDDNRQAPTPGHLTPQRSRNSVPMYDYVPDGPRTPYSDNPYNRFSTAWDPRVSRADIDPNSIEDDGDDGMVEPPQRRRSMLGLRAPPDQARTASATAGGAISGGVLSTLGGLVGRSNVIGKGSRDPSGQYGPVGQPGFENGGVEKSEWLSRQTSGRKKSRWILAVLVAVVLIGAIVGGIIGGIKASKNRSSGSSNSDSPTGETAAADDSKGDLDKDSSEIKKLMNNPALHKVFPGVDYTPYASQYPECLKWPPSQNNVTRDVAVLSQLTNQIRLYGTDCNQTEMVLHAIDRLGLKDMKVWLGVWLDKNTTTNARGLAAMNQLLSKHGADPFLGIIIGNEVLYRQQLTEAELGKILTDTRRNLTSMKIDLPVATSDLGDNWNAALVADTDIVMSNIHPFFAGKTPDIAADWTWNFWETHDTVLTKGTDKKNIISEVGWPSEGGMRCGTPTCPQGVKGAVAGVDEMNHFMDNFVCQSLANGTDFFWFEMFDEPWKEQLNRPGREWEDKWGLMDIGRNLKPGIKIPDCGGKTVS